MKIPVVGCRILMTLLVFEAMAEQQPPALPEFADVAEHARIDFVCRASHTTQKYLVESMLGGVAMFDYDGDGRLDLFFVNGAELKENLGQADMPDKRDQRYWNRLFHNNGDGTFTDVTRQAGVQGYGYGMGVAAGDYDNDGHPDLYVTNYDGNILYHNNGDGTFTDVTAKAGVRAGGWSSSAAFLDYDRDGKLDLVVSRYLAWDIHKNPWCGDRSRDFRAYCHPDVFQPATHVLYHNNGDGSFTDVSENAGFTRHPGNGLGLAVNDFDRDGWPDILVANDALPQQLFRNNHDGTFQEIAVQTGLAYDADGRTYSGMGANFADYDNDGWPDIFICNLANQKYALYRNNAGEFEYISGRTRLGGITMLHSGWGTRFIDYDNDGWKDLFVAQGHVMDNIEQSTPSLRYLESLLLLRNVKGRFEDVSSTSGAPFHSRMAARGAAFGDLDNDGSIDIAVNVNEGRAMVLRNQGSANHWLIVDPKGTLSNRDGIGARVHIETAAGLHQYVYITTSGGYQSSSDKRAHFGLGPETHLRLVEIEWPSGITQRLHDVAADRILKVSEPSTK